MDGCKQGDELGRFAGLAADALVGVAPEVDPDEGYRLGQWRCLGDARGEAGGVGKAVVGDAAGAQQVSDRCRGWVVVIALRPVGNDELADDPLAGKVFAGGVLAVVNDACPDRPVGLADGGDEFVGAACLEAGEAADQWYPVVPAVHDDVGGLAQDGADSRGNLDERPVVDCARFCQPGGKDDSVVGGQGGEDAPRCAVVGVQHNQAQALPACGGEAGGELVGGDGAGGDALPGDVVAGGVVDERISAQDPGDVGCHAQGEVGAGTLADLVLSLAAEDGPYRVKICLRVCGQREGGEVAGFDDLCGVAAEDGLPDLVALVVLDGFPVLVLEGIGVDRHAQQGGELRVFDVDGLDVGPEVGDAGDVAVDAHDGVGAAPAGLAAHRDVGHGVAGLLVASALIGGAVPGVVPGDEPSGVVASDADHEFGLAVGPGLVLDGVRCQALDGGPSDGVLPPPGAGDVSGFVAFEDVDQRSNLGVAEVDERAEAVTVAGVAVAAGLPGVEADLGEVWVQRAVGDDQAAARQRVAGVLVSADGEDDHASGDGAQGDAQ